VEDEDTVGTNIAETYDGDEEVLGTTMTETYKALIVVTPGFRRQTECEPCTCQDQ
jgi:hypothetical protein